ncbi:hypothetical protein H0264_21405 [Nocardia huaxiensis]|uniref:Uncharacterized protein n=1 Tax=Nocardia huaxiensis TaxID=2755382 RepID=A0A7D6VB48_9NOCA|nr:hypothetical protein [Nocardia huaxiensis]QLY27975.1 hypothetical protein H0264_21405 [Nocardia huaxiensis]
MAERPYGTPQEGLPEYWETGDGSADKAKIKAWFKLSAPWNGIDEDGYPTEDVPGFVVRYADKSAVLVHEGDKAVVPSITPVKAAVWPTDSKALYALYSELLDKIGYDLRDANAAYATLNEGLPGHWEGHDDIKAWFKLSQPYEIEDEWGQPGEKFAGFVAKYFESGAEGWIVELYDESSDTNLGFFAKAPNPWPSEAEELTPVYRRLLAKVGYEYRTEDKPEPPEPEPGVWGKKLAALMGDPDIALVADECASVVMTLARAYTRNGFKGTVPDDIPEDVVAVILAASARMAVNPSQTEQYQSAGSMSSRIGAGFQGWSLVEQAVLHRYRKRAL